MRSSSIRGGGGGCRNSSLPLLLDQKRGRVPVERASPNRSLLVGDGDKNSDQIDSQIDDGG